MTATGSPGNSSGRESVVELHGIGKHFDRTRALSRLSLGVARGEVVGVVGDNGAGKSTLLRTIGGVYRPASLTHTHRGGVQLTLG